MFEKQFIARCNNSLIVLYPVGQCSGRIDIIMDYHRTSGSRRLFTTYIFRDSFNWKYENSYQRPARRDPRRINTNWSDLPNNLDAYAHYWEYNAATRVYSDAYFFFKGTDLQQKNISLKLQKLYNLIKRILIDYNFI